MTTHVEKSVQSQIPPLRPVREARNLGLRTVATRAGVDPSYLSRIERGSVTPTLPVLWRLASVLGLRELAALLAPYVRERDAS